MKVALVRSPAYTFFSYDSSVNPPKFIASCSTDHTNNPKATMGNFSGLLDLMNDPNACGNLLVTSEGFGGKEITENSNNIINEVSQKITDSQSFLLNSIFKVDQSEFSSNNSSPSKQFYALKELWIKFLDNPNNTFITPYMNDDGCRFTLMTDPFILRGKNDLVNLFPAIFPKEGARKNNKINITFSNSLFWCKSLFMQKGKEYIRNYKIQQRLPYYGRDDVPFNYLFSSQNQSEKDVYVGGYLNSFLGPIISDNQPYTLFLRICIDVALGPTKEGLKLIDGFSQNKKIFIIQSASVTPKDFFTDASLGAFADNQAIDLIGYVVTKSGKTDRTFETTRWPNTFTLPYGFWVDSLTNEGSLLAKQYFAFLSKFDYMVFADSSGYDFTDDYNLVDLTLDMFGDLDSVQALNQNINRHIEVQEVANLLSASPQDVRSILGITPQNQDIIKIILAPKDVGNIYKITKQTDSSGKVSLLFQQIRREVSRYNNQMDYSLFDLTQLDPPPGQQQEPAAPLEEREGSQQAAPLEELL